MTFAELDEGTIVDFNRFVQEQGHTRSKLKSVWSKLLSYIRRGAQPVLASFEKELPSTLAISTSQLKNILSDLVKLLEKYLAEQRLNDDDDLRALLAFEEAVFSRKTAYIQFKRAKLAKRLHARRFSSSSANHNYLRFLELEHEFDAELKNRADLSALLQQTRQLEQYTTLERLGIYCDIFEGITRQTDILPETLLAEVHALPEVSLPKEEESAEFSLVPIYFHLLSLIRNDDKQSFNYLFERLEEVLDKMSENEQKRIVARLQNFLVTKIIRGDLSYNKYYERVIRLLLVNDAYKISEWEIKNFVTALCKGDEMDLAEELLVKSVSKMITSDKSLVLQYNKAVINLYRERYSKTLELVSRIPLTNRNYYIGSRYIQLYALYKLEEYEGVLSLLDSFHIYVRRAQWLTTSDRAAGIAFAILFRKFAKLQLEKPYLSNEEYQAGIKAVYDKINSNLVLANRSLLRSLIAEEVQ